MNIILYIIKHKYLSFSKLVIDILYLILLLEKFQDFKLIINDNLFKLTKKNIYIYIHRIWERMKKTWINIIIYNIETICIRERYRLGKYYKSTIKK